MSLGLRHYLVYLLLIGAALFVHFHEDVAVPASEPLTNIPTQLGAWQMVQQGEFSEEILAVLKPTDYLSRAYRHDSGTTIGFYLGYHGGGPESGPIHSPKHCLPGGGWWCVAGEEPRSLSIGGDRVELVQAVYQKGEQNNLFLYWYQTRGRSINNEYALKLSEILNSMLHNRRDSAFIRITVGYDDDKESAVKFAEQFIVDFYPAIKSVLPL